MGFHSKNIANKADVIASAWESIAPNDSFGGMTLAQYRNKAKASSDVREVLTSLETQRRAKLDERTDADTMCRSATDLVVNAVRGDPNHGPDSSLLAAMGYTRKS